VRQCGVFVLRKRKAKIGEHAVMYQQRKKKREKEHENESEQCRVGGAEKGQRGGAVGRKKKKTKKWETDGYYILLERP